MEAGDAGPSTYGTVGTFFGFLEMHSRYTTLVFRERK
jgi:hypothetical protein